MASRALTEPLDVAHDVGALDLPKDVAPAAREASSAGRRRRHHA
jgi:hypothetical protein